jgi:hypothetical protein
MGRNIIQQLDKLSKLSAVILGLLVERNEAHT